MLILDKLDEKTARIAMDEGMLVVDRSLIAQDVREGDVLRVQDGLYARDDAATAARREHIRSLLKNRLNLNK